MPAYVRAEVLNIDITHIHVQVCEGRWPPHPLDVKIENRRIITPNGEIHPRPDGEVVLPTRGSLLRCKRDHRGILVWDYEFSNAARR